jgi:hypothetical protein
LSSACEPVDHPFGDLDGIALVVVAPTLKRGDIVIMDNLPVHKVAGVQEAIKAVGVKLLCLPPYSPDLNPIEMAFLKARCERQPSAQFHASCAGWRASLSPLAPKNARTSFAMLVCLKMTRIGSKSHMNEIQPSVTRSKVK